MGSEKGLKGQESNSGEEKSRSLPLVLHFSSPEFFLARLDFSPPSGSPRMGSSSGRELCAVFLGISKGVT